MKFDCYLQTGEKKGSVNASDEIFGIKPNTLLLTRALLRQQDNARRSTAHTKTRGEISFSTKKIWAQKGTGNARHGARSANLFRKGGITFGPRSVRNYKTLMPKKQRRLALFSALSIKAKNQDIVCLKEYSGDIKTKPFATMLSNLPPLQNKKSVLIVLSEKNPQIEKSSRNIPRTKTLLASYLNPKDLLTFDGVLFLADAVKKTESIFLKSKTV